MSSVVAVGRSVGDGRRGRREVSKATFDACVPSRLSSSSSRFVARRRARRRLLGGGFLGRFLGAGGALRLFPAAERFGKLERDDEIIPEMEENRHHGVRDEEQRERVLYATSERQAVHHADEQDAAADRR